MTTLTPTPDDVTFFSSGRVDAAVRDRIVIERAVVRHAATALIALRCTSIAVLAFGLDLRRFSMRFF